VKDLLVVVNINNTRTGYGCFNEQGELVRNGSISTSTDPSAYEEIAACTAPGMRVLCASVVPIATSALAKALAGRGLLLEELRARDDLGIHFGGLDYRELGADLFANAIAVQRIWKRDSLNVDLGTGSTFCVVRSGVYLGTTIVPGMELSLRALTDRAALLSSITLAKPEKIINTTTVECLQSGIYYGYTELVRGMVARIQKEQGKLFVVLTGGIGSFLQDELEDVVDVFDPVLTLRGIKYAADSVPVFPIVFVE
jgi:pantothenate kinase type III